jgi:hypothetical protein
VDRRLIFLGLFKALNIESSYTGYGGEMTGTRGRLSFTCLRRGVLFSRAIRSIRTGMIFALYAFYTIRLF